MDVAFGFREIQNRHFKRERREKEYLEQKSRHDYKHRPKLHNPINSWPGTCHICNEWCMYKCLTCNRKICFRCSKCYFKCENCNKNYYIKPKVNEKCKFNKESMFSDLRDDTCKSFPSCKNYKCSKCSL